MFLVLLTYQVGRNFKFPSSIFKNASVINDDVHSLERCVCFLECFCNIHNMTVLKNISALLTFLLSDFHNCHRLQRVVLHPADVCK